jgi:hypothetical protein
MTDEVLLRHGTTMVGRLVLEPGETMPWQRDPFHRVAVVLGGDLPTFLAPHNSPQTNQAAIGRRCPATARIASIESQSMMVMNSTSSSAFLRSK